MSVLSLSTTLCDIVSVSNNTGVYGNIYHTYTLRLPSVPCRIMYVGGQETVQDGKETLIPTHRIFLPWQISVDATDMIIDKDTQQAFDILYVNTMYGRHMQVDAKMINDIITYSEIDNSSSSSSSSHNSSSSSSSSSESSTSISSH